jgi:hypothetical protein
VPVLPSHQVRRSSVRSEHLQHLCVPLRLALVMPANDEAVARLSVWR